MIHTKEMNISIDVTIIEAKQIINVVLDNYADGGENTSDEMLQSPYKWYIILLNEII